MNIFRESSFPFLKGFFSFPQRILLFFFPKAFFRKISPYFLFFFLLFFSDLSSENKVWINELKGIFLSSSLEVLEEVSDNMTGIEWEDLVVPNQGHFISKLQPFLGKPVSKDLLEEIREKIASFYRDYDYPVVSVHVPAGQDISHGTLRVLVMVGIVGKVKAEGARWFSNEKLKGQLHLKKGDLIRYDEILCDLRWINRTPFHTSSIVFEPGKERGKTDVVLMTKDRFPIRPYVGYENTGNLIAGSSRFLLGLDFAEVSWQGHQLSALFLSSSSVRKWWAITGRDTISFPWRNTLEVSGAYTKARPNKEDIMGLDGMGWQVRAGYGIPFCFWHFISEVSFGYEFKRTNNFLTFADNLIFNQFFDISQFFARYTTEVSYSMGVSTLRFTLFMSPGNMTAYNKTSLFIAERPGARADYTYGLLRYDQTLKMFWGFSWLTNLAFQKSSAHLLPTEQFSLGGYFTIRGYDENEVIGDNGFLLKNEIRTPKFTYKTKKGLEHDLQFLGFLDFGISYDTDQNIVSDDTEVLLSVGPGVRYNFGSWVTFRFDYGLQLKKIIRLDDENDDNSRIHVSLIASY